MDELSFQRNLLNYLISKKIVGDDAEISKLNKGGSGADLYEISSKNETIILKYIDTNKHNSDNIFKLGEKEFRFYSNCNCFNASFLPKVIHTENSDYGIIILLKKYTDIKRSEWNLKRQLLAADIIARIHSKSEDFINALNIRPEPYIADVDVIKKSYVDWINVIRQHSFDERTLSIINNNFGKIINFINTKRHYFCHGDFYPDNFVLDENDELVIIDWQNYNIGGKDEIAFFVSIGYDWGIDIKEEEIKKHYCDRLSNYLNRDIPMMELETECHMSTVFVTFLYWAEYLQNAQKERVKPIFDKLINSYNWLFANGFV